MLCGMDSVSKGPNTSDEFQVACPIVLAVCDFFPLFLAEFVFNVEKWKELCCMLLTVGHLVFAILVDRLVLIIVTKTMACQSLHSFFLSKKTPCILRQDYLTLMGCGCSKIQSQ